MLSAHSDIDLLVLEPYRPNMQGCAGLKAILNGYPTLPVVVLSASEAPQDIQTAIDMGAAGYITKSSSSHTLINALKLIISGGTYAPRLISRQHFQNGENHCKNPPLNLTKRQLQVLTLMAEGLPNKLIARKLFVSEATVKGHVTAILGALYVNNRIQAINRFTVNQGDPSLWRSQMTPLLLDAQVFRA
jgi:DNA-binding NarL/FixJ family response regulator